MWPSTAVGWSSFLFGLSLRFYICVTKTWKALNPSSSLSWLQLSPFCSRCWDQRANQGNRRPIHRGIQGNWKPIPRILLRVESLICNSYQCRLMSRILKRFKMKNNQPWNKRDYVIYVQCIYIQAVAGVIHSLIECLQVRELQRG